jgi:hypothetical protein
MFTDIYRVIVSFVKIRLSGIHAFHAEVTDFISAISISAGPSGRAI